MATIAADQTFNTSRGPALSALVYKGLDDLGEDIVPFPVDSTFLASTRTVDQIIILPEPQKILHGVSVYLYEDPGAFGLTFRPESAATLINGASADLVFATGIVRRWLFLVNTPSGWRIHSSALA